MTDEFILNGFYRRLCSMKRKRKDYILCVKLNELVFMIISFPLTFLTRPVSIKSSWRVTSDQIYVENDEADLQFLGEMMQRI